MASLLLVTAQYPCLHEFLAPGCLGVPDFLLLNDGKMTALYERVYGIMPGGLTPNGCFFRDAFLDRPCAEATKEAQRLLADAWNQLKRLDQASMYATFLKL